MKISLAERFSVGPARVSFLPEGAKFSGKGPGFAPEAAEFIGAFLKRSPLKPGASRRLPLPGGKDVLLVGIPKTGVYAYRKARMAVRQMIAAARAERLKNIEFALAEVCPRGTEPADFLRVAAKEMLVANFEFVKYKEAPQEGWNFVEAARVVVPRETEELAAALCGGIVIGEEINETRVLANTPGGDMTPQVLARAAVEAGKRCGFGVKVLDEKQIARLKMGGVLGVARGSSEKPRFIVMEYLRGPKGGKPVVLVGKGVTFDTGGLNLKPSQAIYEMHMDMSGGAAVIHAMAALARLGAKRNVVGIVPAVENMPSGSSYRPGDMLRTMSGKTIEVLNTDAEGRVILADALTYAQKFYDPAVVIDAATLTGAAMVALGQRASAVFSTDRKLEDEIRDSGERMGDYVWPLPLWEEYEDDVRGTFGDVANSEKTRYGGAISGAMFLWQFMKGDGKKKAPAWAHLDIAPRMTSVDGEYLAKGAAGAPVGLLVDFALCHE